MKLKLVSEEVLGAFYVLTIKKKRGVVSEQKEYFYKVHKINKGKVFLILMVEENYVPDPKISIPDEGWLMEGEHKRRFLRFNQEKLSNLEVKRFQPTLPGWLWSAAGYESTFDKGEAILNRAAREWKSYWLMLYLGSTVEEKEVDELFAKHEKEIRALLGVDHRRQAI